MNLEGGIGGDFLKGGLTVGLDYYASFKLSDDQIRGCGRRMFWSAGRTRAFGHRAGGDSWRSPGERHGRTGSSTAKLPLGDLREARRRRGAR